jgi:hypothetical protein
VNASDTNLIVSESSPFKRGRGRTPVALSNARECRDRITAWKLTPEEKRHPSTLTALAAELGITKQLASYYAQQVPESIEQFVDGAEREALGRYPGVLKTLANLAENGSVEAIKVFIRELAGPRRPQQAQQSVVSASVQNAISALIQQTPPEPKRCGSENRLADAPQRQILSNSDAIEKSTS